jgi:hypothetical protein
MNRPRLPLTAEEVEATRNGFPELTRCDHCGQLDDRTMPTLAFNDHPGDGFYWLHEHCREFFAPTVSNPVETFVEPAEPDPGPGWLRSRFMGRAWPRPGAACGRPACPVCERTNAQPDLTCESTTPWTDRRKGSRKDQRQADELEAGRDG